MLVCTAQGAGELGPAGELQVCGLLPDRILREVQHGRHCQGNMEITINQPHVRTKSAGKVKTLIFLVKLCSLDP